MKALKTEYADFLSKFKSGQSQLVWEWLEADMETPVSAFRKLCGSNPNTFLLESVEGGAVLGRYSIIGMAPDLIWECRGGKISLRRNGKPVQDKSENALRSLKALLEECKIGGDYPGLPPMAVSGLFGYIGYDMVRLIEDIPDSHANDLDIPDSILIRPSLLAIFDNVKNMLCLVTPVYHGQNAEAEDVYQNACGIIDAAKRALQSPITDGLDDAVSKIPSPLVQTSSTEKSEFEKSVLKAKYYIRQGEIFQAVLSRRVCCDFDLPPFALYRSLRRLNPSPFLFFVNLEGFSLVGSSPEILVRVRDNTVTIRPIAGTRKRGKTEEEDNNLAADLLADPKERAEHLMLLDLGRNDVGRVSEYGTVRVTEQFAIERYSHVMHIVSNVEGALKKDMDIVDALFAGFPAGTVSGAPKVRAMQIIDELETSRRSYYGGGIGYFSGNGTLDTCIALRTALVKDGKLYVQAGAGIVADSDPEAEYQETVNKAQAIIAAAEAALSAARKDRNSD